MRLAFRKNSGRLPPNLHRSRLTSASCLGVHHPTHKPYRQHHPHLRRCRHHHRHCSHSTNELRLLNLEIRICRMSQKMVKVLNARACTARSNFIGQASISLKPSKFVVMNRCRPCRSVFRLQHAKRASMTNFWMTRESFVYVWQQRIYPPHVLTDN